MTHITLEALVDFDELLAMLEDRQDIGDYGEPNEAMRMLATLAPIREALRAQPSEALAEGPDVIGTDLAPVPKSVDFDLDPAASINLVQFLTADYEAGEFVEARLSFANGYAGVGLYAIQTDYPDEGALFIAPIAAAPSQGEQEKKG